VIDGEVARNVGPHRSRDKWNEAEEQERSGAMGKDSFRCDHIISFLSSEFESDSQFKPKAIRSGSAKYGLNVAITDNTKYRNHAKEEDDDLNPAFLGAQVCLGPQNAIRLHLGKPR
jgi:hypothetical protein